MHLRSILFLSLYFFVITISAQAKKTLHIERTETAPKIDGVLDDDAWKTAEIATDFIQFRPEIGNKNPETQRTEVKITYDDQAIYVAAYLYDDPSLILRQFTRRDDFGQSDFFLFVLNPNNDAQNDTYFVVTSSGTQADAIVNPTIGEDFTWNAVWDSAVKIVDDGWIVEMKIPYRALRFTAQGEPVWGMQLHRHFRRTRAQFTWNPIDVTQGNIGLYHGELRGLNNIKPPIRLNLYPFSTGIVNAFDGETQTDLNFGVDLKYGITDNFTLDATLVPDFSQAGFDNLALNLGPFEQTFAEQRQFFTEGVELFSKGNLFFSRRIGNAPSGQLDLDDNESVDVPDEVKVLNVVKVSGRTRKGLGIGLLNAITEETSATVRDDVTGEERQEVVEPFTNYNVFVVDQQYNGNSSISLINTNVLREGGFRDANATALVSNFQNKRNTYQINTELKLSHVNFQNSSAETGFSSIFSIGKTHGNFRYSFAHNYADTKYNINDLGLNLRNNQNNFNVEASYQTFEPKGNLNSYRISGSVDYEQLAEPNTFTGIAARLDFFAQHKSLNGFGFNLRSRPGKQFNFFEARNGRPFIFENFVRLGGFYSSNYNKRFAFDLSGSIARIFEEGRDFLSFGLEFSPRFRFNDHILLIFRSEYSKRRGERGFATFENGESLLGNRDRRVVTNSINASYSFNSNHTLALNFRHNWDTVDYDFNLFTLIGDTGRVTTETGFTLDNISSNPNVNFSAWNFDLSYSWQFAPGSFLTALYRNQLFNVNDDSQDTFTGSLSTLFDEPIRHLFSLRIQYFIDFNGITSIFKKNNKS